MGARRAQARLSRTDEFDTYDIPAFYPVIPAKAGIQRGRRGYATEISLELKPTYPFPIHGGRLGWGRGARKRGSAGETPALPGRKFALAIH